MFCSLFDPRSWWEGGRDSKRNRIFSFNKHFLITRSVPSFMLGLVWTEVKHKTRVQRPQTNQGNKQDTTRDGV